jgi:hypothetical protein
MQGLLGLLWLVPREPNWWNETFGRFADPAATKWNQQQIATWMIVIFVAALVWRGLRHRRFALLAEAQSKSKSKAKPKGTLLQAIAPDLDKALTKPDLLAWANRVLTGALLVIALLASVNYFVGTRNNGIYLHRWDAFHTVIGVKYHKELGYFDLYKCAYAIDREGPHHFRATRQIRDLRTRKFVDREQHIAGNDCKERFTPERLEEFRHDLDEFGTWSSKRNWRILFKDKGFNGTPFYATVVKPLVSSVEVSLDGLRRLAYIDPFLMLIAFGFVGWAYGARKAAITAIFFCTFFPNSFEHMGGSILRFDYVAALMVGFAALKKDKWGLAGAMFAWATMVRVFPAIFAVGVGVKIASDVLAKKKLEIREEHWRFVGWYAGLLLLFFVISLIGMDGGFDNWRTWYENMKVHNEKSASYRVGFKHLFMLDGKLTSTRYGIKQQNFEAREAYYWACVALIFAPLLLAVRRIDTVSFAALFGVFGFFLLAIATRYYWGVAAILLLVDRELLRNRFVLLMGLLLFMATAFDWWFWELYKQVEETKPYSLMYNLVVGVELTTVIAALSTWLLFNPSLLDVGEDPRLPSHVPAKLGAKAEPVPLPTKKKKKKKAKKPAEDETDAEPGDGDDNGDDNSEGEVDGLAALASLAAEQAGPSYDPQLVTIPDGGARAKKPAEDGDDADEEPAKEAEGGGEPEPDADTDEDEPDAKS